MWFSQIFCMKIFSLWKVSLWFWKTFILRFLTIKVDMIKVCKSYQIILNLETKKSLTCKEAVVVSIVVTTTLLINSYPAVHRNTDATPNEATTMNTQMNLLKEKLHVIMRIKHMQLWFNKQSWFLHKMAWTCFIQF